MDHDRLFFSHRFLSDFIEEYKSQQCLWDAKSKAYINNTARSIAWEELLSFCRSRLGNVELDWVKKKVHSMKGSFNKERKKMKDARRAGFTGEWQPKLWYYENLLFTKQHEPGDWVFKKEYDDDTQQEGDGPVLLLTGDNYEEEGLNGWTEQPHEETNSTVDSDQEAGESNSEGPASDSLSRKRRASKSGYHIAKKRKSPLEHVEVELGKPDEDDVYEAIGKVVTSKLRALGNIDYTQFIRVDKLINEAIYRGFQKQLTPDCRIAVEGRPQNSNLPAISITTNSAESSGCPPQTYNIYLPPPSASTQIPSCTTVTTTTCTTSNSTTCPRESTHHSPKYVVPPSGLDPDVDPLRNP